MPKEGPKPLGAPSIDEARRISLRAQGFVRGADEPRTPSEMLRQIGYVQLDTISVLARSHELVAYSRLGPVARSDVEATYWGRPATAFEGFGHANCIMPIELWPYFAYKRRMNANRPHPWFEAHEKAVAAVMERLREAPVTATDLGGARRDSSGWWSWSEAKVAVEQLAIQGKAVCVERRGWKRVYDLPERAIPPELFAQDPDDAECFRRLVEVTARAIGVGTRKDILEYFRLHRRSMGRAIRDHGVDEAIEACGLVPIEVEGWEEVAYASPEALANPVAGECRTALLSPFDNLVWDRTIAKRTQRLFGFDYALEVYVPKDKRVHGYFVMPLLADCRLVGRVDPAREGKTLVARNVVLEDAEAVPAAAAALMEAAKWVGCSAIRVERAEPRGALPALTKELG
jgi:uncharacterized protein YcaQ